MTGEANMSRQDWQKNVASWMGHSFLIVLVNEKTAIGEGNIADQSPYQVQGGKAKLCQVKLKYWDNEEKQN